MKKPKKHTEDRGAATLSPLEDKERPTVPCAGYENFVIEHTDIKKHIRVYSYCQSKLEVIQYLGKIPESDFMNHAFTIHKEVRYYPL